jgi:hypothetical protein
MRQRETYWQSIQQEALAGVVATEGRVESLQLALLALTGCFARDFVRGRMSESERQVEGLFESVLNESFGGI